LKKNIFFIFISLSISCFQKQEIDTSLLNGYWEIQSVKKDNKLLKTYPFSGIIDYFEVENGKGLRKKVMPKIDGKFETSLHKINFNIFQKNGEATIEYFDKNNIYSETIVKLDSTELFITNKENYIYHYKVYEKLNFD
tara:strand:- start:55 stop:468 length:414 start_codon:yes stop_codon:yes gene_type:complete